MTSKTQNDFRPVSMSFLKHLLLYILITGVLLFLSQCFLGGETTQPAMADPPGSDDPFGGETPTQFVLAVARPGSDKPASGARLNFIPVDSSVDSTTIAFTGKTDSDGRYVVDSTLTGIFNIYVTYSDDRHYSAFLDSVVPVSDSGELVRKVDLTQSSTLRGYVALQPNHAYRTEQVRIHLLGTHHYTNADSRGAFTFVHLPSHKYRLEASYRGENSEQYNTEYVDVTLPAGVDSLLSDTITLGFFGIPVVQNINATLVDTSAGIARITWNPVSHTELRNYVVYRTELSNHGITSDTIDASADPEFFDTLFRDSIWSDTATAHLSYRVAVREKDLDIGPTWDETSMSVPLPYRIESNVSLRLEGDSTSILRCDSAVVALAVSNAVRPIARIVCRDTVRDSIMYEKTFATPVHSFGARFTLTSADSSVFDLQCRTFGEGRDVPFHGSASLRVIVRVCEKPWPGTVIRVVKYDGTTPAVGTHLAFERLGESSSKFEGTTDTAGCYYIDTTIEGAHKLFLQHANGDTLAAYRDTIHIVSGRNVVRTISLEQTGSIAGTVALQPHHASSLGDVRVQVLGLHRYAFADENGRFKIQGIPAGAYTVHVTHTGNAGDEYRDVYLEADLPIHTDTVLTDTMRPPYSGIPIVRNISATHTDTLNGIVTIRWSPVEYPEMRNYILLRELVDSRNNRIDTFSVGTDTVFSDTVYAHDPGEGQRAYSDPEPVEYRYRIAVKTNDLALGQTYYESRVEVVSPQILRSTILMSVSRIRDEADTNIALVYDSLRVSITASNTLRSIARLAITDTIGSDTIYRVAIPAGSMVSASFNITRSQADTLVLVCRSFIQSSAKPLPGADTAMMEFAAYAYGPDHSGYAWTDSDHRGGPEYEWHDIVESGSRAVFDSAAPFEGEGYDSLSLPFDFPFYGKMHRKAYINLNGFLSLDSSSLSELYTWENHDFPTGSTGPYPAPYAAIAGYHDDLDKFHDSVYYQVNTLEAVVQYEAMMRSHNDGQFPENTFQITLKPSGDILFYYKDTDVNGASPTIGIQNHDRDIGLTILYRANGQPGDPYTHPGKAVLIRKVK